MKKRIEPHVIKTELERMPEVKPGKSALQAVVQELMRMHAARTIAYA